MDNVNIEIKIDSSKFIKSIKKLSLFLNTRLSAIARQYIRFSKERQQEDILIKQFESEMQKVKEISNNTSSMNDSLQMLGIELNKDKINRIRRPIKQKQKAIKNWKKSRFYE